MPKPVIRKRPRVASATRKISGVSNHRRYLVDEKGKRVAIVLDLDEYRRLIASESSQRARLSAAQRAKLVTLARQAEGNWKATEPQGASVEVVRRLRDEWEHRG